MFERMTHCYLVYDMVFYFTTCKWADKHSMSDLFLQKTNQAGFHIVSTQNLHSVGAVCLLQNLDSGNKLGTWNLKTFALAVAELLVHQKQPIVAARERSCCRAPA